jgi:riboflavin synthase
MFTGLVETVGSVSRIAPIPGGVQIEVQTELADALREGDSVAVNGVCLTVAAVRPAAFDALVGPETARVTNLGVLERGALVNLERPLRADARLGGHFVLGHVDATGTIRGIDPADGFWWVSVEFPPALAPYLIPKGSIAVDGISLTIARLEDRDFTVQIVPFTWDHTNLRRTRPGTAVNLECDMIGKYIVRLAQRGAS